MTAQDKRYQVKFLDEKGQQHGEAEMLTDREISERLSRLPDDWSTEEV